MNTVINNPPSVNNSGESDSGLGVILGVLVALVLIVLFFVYALPALRNQAPRVQDDNDTTNIDIDLPNPLPSDDTPENTDTN